MGSRNIKNSYSVTDNKIISTRGKTTSEQQGFVPNNSNTTILFHNIVLVHWLNRATSILG